MIQEATYVFRERDSDLATFIVLLMFHALFYGRGGCCQSSREARRHDYMGGSGVSSAAWLCGLGSYDGIATAATEVP